MLDELTSIQLSEWQVYDRLEPIGEDRADYRIAALSSLVMNIARAYSGMKGEMTTPDMFMLEWDKDLNEEDEPRRPTQQSVEEQERIWLAIASEQNKRVKKQKEREKKLSKHPSKLKGKKK